METAYYALKVTFTGKTQKNVRNCQRIAYQQIPKVFAESA